MELNEGLILYAISYFTIMVMCRFFDNKYKFNDEFLRIMFHIPVAQYVALFIVILHMKKIYMSVPWYLQRTISLMLNHKDYEANFNLETITNNALQINIKRDMVIYNNIIFETRLYRPFFNKTFRKKTDVNFKTKYLMYKQTVKKKSS